MPISRLIVRRTCKRAEFVDMSHLRHAALPGWSRADAMLAHGKTASSAQSGCSIDQDVRNSRGRCSVGSFLQTIDQGWHDIVCLYRQCRVMLATAGATSEASPRALRSTKRIRLVEDGAHLMGNCHRNRWSCRYRRDRRSSRNFCAASFIWIVADGVAFDQPCASNARAVGTSKVESSPRRRRGK